MPTTDGLVLEARRKSVTLMIIAYRKGNTDSTIIKAAVGAKNSFVGREEITISVYVSSVLIDKLLSVFLRNRESPFRSHLTYKSS